MLDIPLIYNKHDQVIIPHFFAMPGSAHFGLPQTKYDDILKRIYLLNKIISQIFLDHNLFVKAFETEDHNFERINQNFYSELRFKTETLIYWLRKTTDELIGLQYYLEYYSDNEVEPPSIKMESIGALLNCNCKLLLRHNNSKEFLILLNEISNTYKHSFVNYESNFLIGRYEPTVNAIQMKYNKRENHPKLYEEYLRRVVHGFTKFFNDSIEYLHQLNSEFFNKLKNIEELKSKDQAS